MKNWKRIVVCSIALILMVSLVACGESATDAETEAANTASETDQTDQSADTTNADQEQEEGDKLVIYTWNDEFQQRFTEYFDKPGLLPEGVEVEFVITPDQDNVYQNKLDEDLPKNQDAPADEKIDIFIIEADYASKYVDSEYTLDIVNDIGLTEEDLANQYEYTQTIVSDQEGNLKATSWHAAPGTFVYRRSIAKEVLGTDDPDEVQALLADWDKFDAVAAQMSGNGYKMLSGYADSYRTFSNNVSAPWVDENNKINVNPNIMRWVEQTKEYTDNGYNNRTSLWANEWNSDMGVGSDVFGFFHAPWGINYVMLPNALETPVSEGGVEEIGNGLYGDWAVCLGPQSFYWGGAWICAAAGTDNLSLVRDIMYTLTCDKDSMKQLTTDIGELANNKAAMREVADSDYTFDFLGGQNHIKMLNESANNIDLSNISKYDQGMNEEFQAAFRDYFDGIVTNEEALENFYKAIIEKYPNLTR